MARFGRWFRFPSMWDTTLLGVWLILYGLALLADLRFANSDLVFRALAVAAGVSILIGRGAKGEATATPSGDDPTIGERQAIPLRYEGAQ